MPQRKDYVPEGVIPACLLPLFDDYEIDEPHYRKHLRDIATVPGLNAITVNGHASEVSACTLSEQRRVLAVALDEVGDRIPIVNGIFSENTLEGARIARESEHAGAAALLVSPPSMFRDGAQYRPAMAYAHFSAIADACSLPIILFQFPLSTGLGFTLETQMWLADKIPTLRATKDACGDPVLFERTVRTLQGRSRPVNVLTTHTSWLFASLVTGCAGLLSGAGSVIAPLQVALFQALQENRLADARAIHERIYPMTEAFYAPPFIDMHNRMKEVLVLLGKLPRAVVRPPLVKLPQSEIDRLETALRHAGLWELQPH